MRSPAMRGRSRCRQAAVAIGQAFGDGRRPAQQQSAVHAAVNPPFPIHHAINRRSQDEATQSRKSSCFASASRSAIHARRACVKQGQTPPFAWIESKTLPWLLNDLVGAQ